jgi:hypothetical protein
MMNCIVRSDGGDQGTSTALAIGRSLPGCDECSEDRRGSQIYHDYSTVLERCQ